MRLRVRYGFVCCAILLGLLVSCETNVDEEFKNHFIKYYGGDGNQEAQDFVVNADGTIVIIGTSYEVDLSKRIYVAKVSAEGEVIWKRTWGGPMNEVVRDLEPIKSGTYRGGFLLLSNVNRDDSDSTNVKVLRFTSDGTKIDSVTFDHLSSQFGYSITSLSDGGFVFTGNTTDIDFVQESGPNNGLPAGVTDKEDPLIVRYAEDLIAPDAFVTSGGEELVMGVKIIERGAGFYFVGTSNSSLANPDRFLQKNFLFARMTALGSIQLPVFFGGGDRLNEEMRAIALSGNVFMAVGTQLVQPNQNRIYIKVVDRPFEAMPDNIPLFEGENIGPSNAEAASVCAGLEPNTFWVLGSEVQSGGRNIWVSKVSYDFGTQAVDEQISMSFGGSNNDDTGSAIAVLENGDILILGTMELVNQKKIALIKVKANGQF